VVDLNLDAVWYGMQAALRVMIPQRRGCILTTSSGAGLGGVPGLSAYGAAKAGVIQLTRNLAIEYGPLGIRANVICPGPMSTPQMEAWLATLGPAGERFGRQVPLGRLGHADEIASAAVFLASDEAAYVTGAVLAVDGGVSAAIASPRVE
jgi:3-oxoacyl-[acyl-carrier protein] reductase